MLDSPFNQVVQSFEKQSATLVGQATVFISVPRPMLYFWKCHKQMNYFMYAGSGSGNGIQHAHQIFEKLSITLGVGARHL